MTYASSLMLPNPGTNPVAMPALNTSSSATHVPEATSL